MKSLEDRAWDFNTEPRKLAAYDDVPSADLFEGEPEALRARLENMYEFICHLLLKNQQLRMRLAKLRPMCVGVTRPRQIPQWSERSNELAASE
jgi:hypothetical protein